MASLPKADLRNFAQTSTEILSILDHQLATISDENGDQSATHAHQCKTPMPDQILFYKMKADAHRYLAELAAPLNHRERVASHFPAESTVEADCALSAYKIASGMAHEHLEACHPLRLMLAFNFSTFYADVRHSLRMAIHIAKTAYESACEIVHVLSGSPQYQDAIRVLQLIRDNLSTWSLQLATGEAYADDEESDVDVDEDWEQEQDEDVEEDSSILIMGSPTSGGERRDSVGSLGSPGAQQQHASSAAQIKSMSLSSPARAHGSGGSRHGSRHGSRRGSGIDSRVEAVQQESATTDLHPSASAPVLNGVTGGLIKGHGGRALRPDLTDSRPDSAPKVRRTSTTTPAAGGTATAAGGTTGEGETRIDLKSAPYNTAAAETPLKSPSKSRKRRRKSMSLLSEGAVPIDHLESLLRGAQIHPFLNWRQTNKTMATAGMACPKPCLNCFTRT